MTAGRAGSKNHNNNGALASNMLVGDTIGSGRNQAGARMQNFTGGQNAPNMHLLSNTQSEERVLATHGYATNVGQTNGSVRRVKMRQMP